MSVPGTFGEGGLMRQTFVVPSVRVLNSLLQSTCTHSRQLKGQRNQPILLDHPCNILRILTSGPFGDSMSAAASYKRWGVSRQA
jgi:hypothetical protein